MGANGLETDDGKSAYTLAGQIAEARAVHRWKELMALYHSATSPAGQAEVVRVAASLAMASGILEWKMEVNAKANDLKARGHL